MKNFKKIFVLEIMLITALLEEKSHQLHNLELAYCHYILKQEDLEIKE